MPEQYSGTSASLWRSGILNELDIHTTREEGKRDPSHHLYLPLPFISFLPPSAHSVALPIKDFLLSYRIQLIVGRERRCGCLVPWGPQRMGSGLVYSGIRIGPVVKKDVMKVSAMLEHESQYATILAFDVKIERDAQELADSLGVKIFQADIIYHLFDKFMAYRDELKQRKRDQFKHIAVFPCKLKVLPQFVFNSRDPIVMGVMVEAGVVKEGTPICVPSKEQ
ncbi:hypothetical protein J437_LFUL006433 [Ladona fulva]|uniref:Translation initiation factor IF- 2 domain-containing protein n=1 Tax=Ladona fulva TaxID=123851 RepID=A0A8K0JYZ3_LADFU|nr:hypothetical protein J437_LFUL006433 [Ladona fulva]